MQLSQKENLLLKDLSSHEQLCIEKYSKYANNASDPQLKNLFTQISQVEQQHLQTLNQISAGTVPAMGGGSGGSTLEQFTTTPTYMAQENSPDKQKDSYLCQDLLSTEKHVSSLYDTCIFEFKDVGVRDALNHIQKEEQEHGQKLYSYMEQNGMYN